jgi:ABC-type glycerol-3-phosphate transport system substrate-binding protein
MFGTAQMFSVASPEKSTSHDVNVPLAVEYLRRWTSRENQAKQAETLAMIPAVKDVAPPASTTGMDAAVEKSATADTIIYYYGIHWDTALWAAWYQPVQALFLGRMTAEEMVAQIDANLEEYRSLKQSGG